MVKLKIEKLNTTALALTCFVILTSQIAYGMEEDKNLSSSSIVPKSNMIKCNNGFEYRTIQSFEHILQHTHNLRPGDVVVLDIDGVLLSKGGNQWDADLLENKILSFFSELNQNNIVRFCLTARAYDQRFSTSKNLAKFGLTFSETPLIDFQDTHAKHYKGLVFSPNLREEEKISTKLETLHKILGHLKDKDQSIKRVIFIDDESFHFTQHQNSHLKFSEDLYLFEFSREFKPSYASTPKDPPNLETLTYLETKSGGSGGVAVFQDPSGKKWTLKSWKNREHGINECLGAALYKKLGGKTPDFFLYNDLPKNLQKEAHTLAQGGFFRIAEYIEGDHPHNEQLKELVTDSFLATAFVSFWDIKPDNYIVDKRGALHLIDTGSSLLFRSLGNPKNEGKEGWMAHQVSELLTFRQPENRAHSVFRDVDVKKIEMSLQPILSLREDLLNEINKFCEATYYKDKSRILHFVESRLNHLDFLNDFYKGKYNSKADPFVLATLKDAAGTLIYTYREGVPYFLIGKRVGHQWWGNLGGHTNLGEYLLSQTAARETREESGINIAETVIQKCPSHDSVYLEEGVLLRRYRTYLVKQNEINLATLESDEFREYKYVAAADILEALQEKKWISAENTQTLELKDRTLLHPPFVESLSQDQIKKWLSDLINKKPIPATCTQSIVGHQTLRSLEKVPTHSNSDQQAFILALTEMGKAKAKLSPRPKKDLSQKTPPQGIQTASYSMLDSLYNQLPEKEREEGSVINKITKVVNTSNIFTTSQVEIIENIIQKEQLHGDKHVLYHGLIPEVWFNYRLLSRLRHALNGIYEVQTTSLRSSDSFFQQLPTAMDLLNHILEGNNDHSNPFRNGGISFNPTLFSNLDNRGDCTLNYFFEGRSVNPPKERWSIINTFLNGLGISNPILLSQLDKVFEKTMAGNPGCLLQFFVDSLVVNQACYASHDYGEELRQENGEPFKDILKMLNSIRNNTKFILKSREKREIPPHRFQIRLHADLAKFGLDKIRVYDYFSDGNQKRLEEIDNSIDAILENRLPEIMQGLSYNNSVYSSKTPAILEIIRKYFKIKPFELKSEDPFIRAVLSGNHDEIMRLYLEDPSRSEIVFTHPSTLETIKAKDSQFVGALTVYDEKVKNLAEKYKIIKKETDTFRMVMAVKSLKELGLEEVERLMQLVSSHRFVKDEATSDDILSLLEAIKNLGENSHHIIELACGYKMIKENSPTSFISNTLRTLGDLKENVENVLHLANQYDLIESPVICVLLSVLNELGEDAEKILRLAKQCDLIKAYKNDFEICKILRNFQQLGVNAEKILKFAQEHKLIKANSNPDKVFTILNKLKSLGREKVTAILLRAREHGFIKEGMEIPDVIQLLDTIN